MPPSVPITAALSIAGSDSGGNAGIQADLLSFAANGVYGTTAITCLTAQNPEGISALEAATAEVVDAQIKQALSYYPIRGIKTGMLFNREIVQTVARRLGDSVIPLVVDPVCVATSGQSLLQADAIAALKENLLPLADVITPNLDEAKLLLGREIDCIDDMDAAALEFAKTYRTVALIKGGHLPGNELVDVVATPDGALRHFQQERIPEINTHGSGCTLSSAIAAHLALGKSPLEAITNARDYLRRGMENPICLQGSHFINHFPVKKNSHP